MESHTAQVVPDPPDLRRWLRVIFRTAGTDRQDRRPPLFRRGRDHAKPAVVASDGIGCPAPAGEGCPPTDDPTCCGAALLL